MDESFARSLYVALSILYPGSPTQDTVFGSSHCFCMMLDEAHLMSTSAQSVAEPPWILLR